jgi:hypothetical protein
LAAGKRNATIPGPTAFDDSISTNRDNKATLLPVATLKQGLHPTIQRIGNEGVITTIIKIDSLPIETKVEMKPML